MPRSAGEESIGSLASKVGWSASASVSPVRVSSTTAAPDSPPEPWTASRSTRWVYHCTSRSMVSWRSEPFSGATTLLSPSGSCCPPPISYVAEPSLPDSRSSKISSKPASGSPSVPMNPSRFAATSLAG